MLLRHVLLEKVSAHRGVAELAFALMIAASGTFCSLGDVPWVVLTPDLLEMWNSVGMRLGSGLGKEGITAPFSCLMLQCSKEEPWKSQAGATCLAPAARRDPRNQPNVKLLLNKIYPSAFSAYGYE